MATVRTLGKQFKNTSINGNAIDIATLIAPQDNVNGLILRTLTVGSGEVSIGAKLPANGNGRFDQTLNRIPTGTTLYNDVLVPAGMGVFLNTTANFNISV